MTALLFRSDGRRSAHLGAALIASVIGTACGTDDATGPPVENGLGSGGFGNGSSSGGSGGLPPSGSGGVVPSGSGGNAPSITTTGGALGAGGGPVSASGGFANSGGSTSAGSGGAPPPGSGGTVTGNGGQGSGGSAVVTPGTGCGAGATGAAGTFTMDVGGTSRSYIVAVPTGYDKTKPYKLIFTWHYLGGSAQGIASGGYYGLQRLSSNTAIFVSPEGIDAGWSNAGGRDVAFATQLMAKMKSSYCVDTAHVFSVGFSYGAIMSNTVGCALGDQFRAIAPMSGSGPRGTGCKGPVAAWLSHGDQDTTVPFASGQASRDHWVTANHCANTSKPVGSCVAYDGCDPGYPVVWCQFSGGHTQPRNSAADIWAFLSQF